MCDLVSIADNISTKSCNSKLRGPYRPYATLGNDIEVVISKNHASMVGTDDLDVDVFIEAPINAGFKSVRINVPSLRIEHVDGMSDDEVKYYRKYVAKHCSDIADRLEEIWNADDC